MTDYEFEFRIGDAFPEDNPVARYLTVLAMMHNDWKRTMAAMNESLEKPQSIGERVFRFRQLIGYAHEAVEFLDASKSRYQEIGHFLASLGDAARSQYEKVFSSLEGFERWLNGQRDITFHYPAMLRERYQAGDEAVANALRDAADDISSATLGPKYADVRFDFADAVAIWLLGFDLANRPEDREELRRLTVALREAQWALGEFVQHAVGEYLSRRPPGAVRAA
jgi:hypothetical protein